MHTLSLIPSFAALPAHSLARVQAIARLRILRRGQRLWSEGETGEVCSFIVEGHIKLVKRRGEGEERILGLFGPGVVGYTAVARRSPYLASAVALQEVVVLECPWDLWWALLGEDSALMAATHDALVEHGWYLLNRAHEFCAGPVAQRLAALLVGLLDELGVRRQREGAGMCELLPVALTRQEVAEMIDARPETVVRQLSQWRQDGILALDEHGIWALDSTQLRALMRA